MAGIKSSTQIQDIENVNPLVEEKYGIRFNAPIPLSIMELFCFRKRHSIDQGGLGRYGHLREFVRIMWPNYKWNPWSEWMIQEACENDYLGLAGCAASGKTYGITLYAMAWWAADPLNSSVVLTSTTSKMIRKRQWAALQELRGQSIGFPGNMVDSKTTLQAEKGDDKHGIFAQAVAEGPVEQAVANIQGIHAARMLVIVDEATDTPEAIFDATENLKKGTTEFQLIVIGNPNSYFDPHGRFCEPVDGWKSISVESESWKTKQGICIHFDGNKTPNYRAAGGRIPYPYLIAPDQVAASKRDLGEDSVGYWKFTRGFWAPEGASISTVLNEALCVKFHTMDGALFQDNVKVIGGLDPAFGGDRCVLRFAHLGRNTDGRMTLLFSKSYIIRISAESNEPASYQIARKTMEICSQEGCPPENLGVDSTGNGSGVCDILSSQWSNRIKRTCFGGAASDMPATGLDNRPAHEVYKNRVTELWFSVREWVMADQIRGLDADTIKEFCSRYFTGDKKIEVESKRDMKDRSRKSPDLADAASIIVDVARQLGASGTLKAAGGSSDWSKWVKQSNRVYETPDLMEEVS